MIFETLNEMKMPPKRTPSALRQYLIEQGHTELLDETEDEAIHKLQVSITPSQEERSAELDEWYFRNFRPLSSPVEVIKADARKVMAEWRGSRDELLHELKLRDYRRMQEWVRPCPKNSIYVDGETCMVDLRGLPVPIHFQRRNALLNVLGIFYPLRPFPVDLKAIHAVKSIRAVLRESGKRSRRRRGR